MVFFKFCCLRLCVCNACMVMDCSIIFLVFVRNKVSRCGCGLCGNNLLGCIFDLLDFVCHGVSVVCIRLSRCVCGVRQTLCHDASVFHVRLAEVEEECQALRAKAGLLNDYQSEVRRLREDIALLTARRDRLLSSPSQPSPRPSLPSSKPPDLANGQG